MTLGLTNGSSFGAIAPNPNNRVTYICTEGYGRPVGTHGVTAFGYSIGVTTDPTKSGIVAYIGGLSLPSTKLGRLLIHY